MSICGTWSQSGIPNGKQDGVVKGFKDNVPPPTSVTKKQAEDGSWTVTAEWPPCEAGITVSHSANNISD